MVQFWRLFTVFLLGVSIFSARTIRAQSEFYKGCKPEAAFVIKRHQMGADLVDVTVSSSSYSASLLEEKIEALNEVLKGNVRGVSVGRVSDSFIKGSFAINGLINDQEPKLNIAAIAKAFGTGKGKFKQFSVFFENIVPDRSVPARWFPEDNSWRLEGVASRTPLGVDYRIEVNTDDASKIELPGPKPIAKQDQKAEKAEGPDFVLIGAILVGALAVGLLVYSALTRPQKR